VAAARAGEIDSGFALKVVGGLLSFPGSYFGSFSASI